MLNEIIEAHVGLWWTEKSKGKLRALCSKEEFQEIESIGNFAIEHEVWGQGCYSTACMKIEEILKEAYPHLSELAIKKISKMAAFQHREGTHQ